MYRIGIFTPVYFREDLAERCLISLAGSNFMPRAGVRVFLCVGINGASSNFKKNFLREYSARHRKVFSFIRVFDENKNVGKPAIINYMSEKSPDFDHLVSMDSDMETINADWLCHFLKVFELCPNGIRLGALCANQKGHSVHTATSGEHWKTKVGPFTLVTTPNNSKIAGGVLITPGDVWKSIGGYRASNIYGSDDGSYAVDCQSKGLKMAYVEEILFNHPLNEDMGYAEWKLRAAYDRLKPGEENGFFEHMRG